MKYTFLLICLSIFSLGLQAQSSNPFELHSDVKDSASVNGMQYQEVTIDTSITIEGSEIVDSFTIPITTELLPALDTSPLVEASPLVETSALVEAIDTFGKAKAQSINPFSLRSGFPQADLGEVLTEIDSLQIPSEEVDSTFGGQSDVENIEDRDTLTTSEEESILDRLGSPLSSGNNNFVFWLTLVTGLLLSILFNGNRGILSDMLKSMRNMNFMKLFQKEQKNGSSMSFVLLYMIYLLNFSVLVRFIFKYFEWPVFGYNFTLILLAVTVLTLLRHLSLSVISYLRKKLADAISYSFIIIIINSLLGLFLIPINLLIAFGPDSLSEKFVIIGVVTVLVAFLLRWFRGFINSARIILGDSFHFLLYLCTCEIAPICIGIGFVRNLIN